MTYDNVSSEVARESAKTYTNKVVQEDESQVGAEDARDTLVCS